MPFAPVVLAEEAAAVFDISKSLYAAEFMTICCNTRKDWVGMDSGVVDYLVIEDTIYWRKSQSGGSFTS